MTASSPAAADRVRNAVYDLNNLLAVIDGYALLLAESLPPGEPAEWAAALRQAAHASAAAVRELTSAAQLSERLWGEARVGH